MSKIDISKINRNEAIQNNLVVYISGTQCKKCGSYEKYVSSYGCVPCNIKKGLEKLQNNELMAPYRTKEKQTKYTKEHPEKIREIKYLYANSDKGIKRKKNWYKNGGDKIVRNNILKRTYNITEIEYNEMLHEQNNACKICSRDASNFTRNFHIDHDHKTGKIRSLLCHYCNTGLGAFNDNIELMQKAINYLQEHV